ncbi:polysaccharide biosynthesis tyrosine autokinase [Methylobacter sp. sgz302048]|uniref:polysaccharide biosynthesis tyrosine autokinase n=1 Tax=Methylobacter sp. sgz302048 TaxID=3455945 RepID=UPI003F9EED1D
MSTIPFNKSSSPASFFSEEENDEIDLGELLATLMESKWLIISAVLFALTIGISKTFLDTPEYKSNTMLQIVENAPSLGELEPLSGLVENKKPIMAEIEIIKSRMILGEAVKNLNLEIIAKPQYFPFIGEAIARHFQQNNVEQISTPLFGQSHYAWGGEIIQVDTLKIPSSWLNKKLTLIAGEHGRFKLMNEEKILLEGEAGKYATQQLEGTQDSISIFVSQLKARPDTQFIVMRQSELNAVDQLKQRFEVTEKIKNTGILELTLESPSPQAAAKTVNEIANIYVRLNVEQKSEEAQKRIEFLDKQSQFIKDQLQEATANLNNYQAYKGSIDLTMETQGILNAVVEKKTQLTLLQQKHEELRQKFTESYPAVIALQKQMDILQNQIGEYEREVKSLPETQQTILRLSKDVQVNSELYMSLLNNSQTLKVAKAGAVGDVRIIDEAVLPTVPIKPKKILIIAISLIAGLIIGVILTFVRKFLNKGIDSSNLIEKYLNIPVYVTIPHSAEQTKIIKQKNGPAKILALDFKDDLAIESLRSLRTTLHFAFLEAKNNIIMITGPRPGVGKSFVSLNLAIVLADAGKKVLLIDADMRKGLLNKAFGIKREEGLSELISGLIAPSKGIRHIEASNIDFITTGDIPPNPSELLMHERFGQLLEVFSKRYDHVIIDTPPSLLLTDASIVGRLASVTLLTLKAGIHSKQELEQCTKRLAQSGVQVKGIVLNDLPERSLGNNYGYGYGYGYGKDFYKNYNYKLGRALN